MKKVVIFYDEFGKCKQIITPFRQDMRDKACFDGNWRKLVIHVTGSTEENKKYYKYEVV
jgi:hypothetical protein